MGRNPQHIDPILAAYRYMHDADAEYAATTYGIFARYGRRSEWTFYPIDNMGCLKHADLVNRLSEGEGLAQIPISELKYLAVLRGDLAVLELRKLRKEGVND